MPRREAKSRRAIVWDVGRLSVNRDDRCVLRVACCVLREFPRPSTLHPRPFRGLLTSGPWLLTPDFLRPPRDRLFDNRCDLRPLIDPHERIDFGHKFRQPPPKTLRKAA